MKYLYAIMLFFVFGCEEQLLPFPVMEHEALKKQMMVNYRANTKLFQNISSKVSKFKILRSVDFMYGRGMTNEIQVYRSTLNRETGDTEILIKNLLDPKMVAVLNEEGISVEELKAIKSQLDAIGCNSFFTFRALDPETGKYYIHTELRYNTWNGINFYYYKLFDKKIDINMVRFFERNLVNVNEGEWKNKGGILDSNAIWYYVND